MVASGYKEGTCHDKGLSMESHIKMLQAGGLVGNASDQESCQHDFVNNVMFNACVSELVYMQI